MERLEQMKINQLRDNFFPGWYLYGPSIAISALRPLYRVVCDTWDEYLDARRVKPSFVKAEIIYKPR